MSLTPAQWNAFGFMCSFLLPFLAVIFLSRENIYTTFIIFGHGHFLLTYIYQWRAGRIGMLYGGSYFFVCSILFFIFSTFPEPQLWTLVAAGSIFSVHFFVDEMFINNQPLSWRTRLLGVAFVILYAALLLRNSYEIDAPLLVILLTLALCAPVILSRIRERTISAPEMFFLSSSGVLAIMVLVPISISLASALAFIILFHYLRWYLHYFFKFQAEVEQTRFRRYIRDVVVCNALVVALYLAYVYIPVPFLTYLFEPMYFFAWTVLHVLFSIRIPKRVIAAISHA